MVARSAPVWICIGRFERPARLQPLTAACCRVLLWASVVLILMCTVVLEACSQSNAGGAQHIYVLDCEGGLHILMDGSDLPETVLELSSKTPLIPLGNDTGGEVSGCATSSAVSLPQQHQFATLVQTSGDYDETGGHHYRVVRFQLPEMRYAGASMIPGSFQDPPRLENEHNGRLRLISDEHSLLWNGRRWLPVSSPMPQDGLPRAKDGWATLNLAGYHSAAAEAHPLPASIRFTRLQHSGDAVLVHWIAPGLVPAYAVIWPQKRLFVLLKQPFVTDPQHLELAPAGQAVIMLEVVRKASQEPENTGKIAVLDGVSGSLLRTLQEPMLTGRRLSGVTPNGSLVLFDRSRYHLRPLGRPFPAVPVWEDAATYLPRPFEAP